MRTDSIIDKPRWRFAMGALLIGLSGMAAFACSDSDAGTTASESGSTTSSGAGRGGGVTSAGGAGGVVGTSGQLDTSFGQDGVITTSQPASRFYTLVVDGGDNLYTTHSCDGFCIEKRLPDGALDANFGEGGLAKREIFGASSATGLTLDAQGRLVAATNETFDEIWVARFDPLDGTPDPGFGNDGVVEITVEDIPGSSREIDAITALDDGRIVIAASNAYDGTVIWRMDPTGAVDTQLRSQRLPVH